MAYDSSLDEKIFSKSCDTEGARITVSVYSYNNGPKKVQVTREAKDREGNFNFVKLGRLSKDELTGVLPILQEALKAL